MLVLPPATNELCYVCGGGDLHRPWCMGVRKAMWERNQGMPPTDEWPWWMEQHPSDMTGARAVRRGRATDPAVTPA